MDGAFHAGPAYRVPDVVGMEMRVRVIPWMVAALVLALVPARALACLCQVSDLRLPGDGATSVPLNTAIWVSRSALMETPTLTMVGSGDAVPMTCLDLGPVQQCRPNTPLQPLTRYRVDALRLEFTTGTARDDDAPPPPSEVNRRYHSTSGVTPFRDNCDPVGPAGAVVLSVRGVETILVVDTSGRTQPAAPATPVTLVQERPPTVDVMDAWIGTWTCRSTMAAGPGDRFPLRMGAFDVAGNFSGWVQLRDAAIPYAPVGCSCSTSDASLGAMLTLVFMALRKRRVHGA